MNVKQKKKRNKAKFESNKYGKGQGIVELSDLIFKYSSNNCLNAALI